MRQKGDVKPVSYWRPTHFGRHFTKFSRPGFVCTCCGVSYCNEHNTCWSISEVLLSNGERGSFPLFVFPKYILVVTEGCVSSGNEGLVKEFRKSYVLRLGSPSFLWQRAAPVFVGCFAGLTWKNNDKRCTQLPKWMRNFCSVYTVYKCDRGPPNGTWRASGLGTHVQRSCNDCVIAGSCFYSKLYWFLRFYVKSHTIITRRKWCGHSTFPHALFA